MICDILLPYLAVILSYILQLHHSELCGASIKSLRLLPFKKINGCKLNKKSKMIETGGKTR